MTFNEFTRRLEKCHLDPDTKFILSHMFEVQIEYSKQLDTLASTQLDIARAMENLVGLHGDTQEKMKQMLRHAPDGVEVASVRNDPEDE
jgi:hypothetical protein